MACPCGVACNLPWIPRWRRPSSLFSPSFFFYAWFSPPPRQVRECARARGFPAAVFIKTSPSRASKLALCTPAAPWPQRAGLVCGRLAAISNLCLGGCLCAMIPSEANIATACSLRAAVSCRTDRPHVFRPAHLAINSPGVGLSLHGRFRSRVLFFFFWISGLAPQMLPPQNAPLCTAVALRLT